jgi:hypothetical protein
MHTPTFRPYNLRALNGRKVVANLDPPKVAVVDETKVAPETGREPVNEDATKA